MLLEFKNFVKPDREKNPFLTPSSCRNEKVKVALRKEINWAIFLGKRDFY